MLEKKSHFDVRILVNAGNLAGIFFRQCAENSEIHLSGKQLSIALGFSLNSCMQMRPILYCSCPQNRRALAFKSIHQHKQKGCPFETAFPENILDGTI
jgi:hypothetical protein